MAARALGNVIQRLRTLAGLPQVSQLPDRELLERFLQQHDEAAFTALVERHGPMVLRVCRNILHHHQDAEDACQATFLVLVRKAASIRKLTSLGSWLHGVALRVASKLRVQLARVHQLQNHLPQPQPNEESRYTSNELGAILDEELQRLPEKFRAPLILCYLQARTRDEAASELGWKPSTLKGRLEWGRKLLRQRLAWRGVTLSTTLLVLGLNQPATAAVPASLVISVVKSGLALATGKSLTAGLVSPQIASLVQATVSTLLFQQIRSAVAGVLLALCLGGAGWLTHQALTQPARDTPPANAAFAALAQQPRAAQARPENEILPPVAEAQQDPPVQDRGSSLIQRGDHLVKQVMRCGDCHTPRNGRGELDLSRHLQGSSRKRAANQDPREWGDEDKSPDITLSGRAGKWSEEKMTKFLTRSAKSDPFPSAHKLALEDARAVTAYLRSLPGKKKSEVKKGD